MKERVGELDCALSCVTGAGGDQVAQVPGVTCVNHKDNLNIGVGTSTGHVLLFDIRSSKPLLVKDHMYNLPIKNVSFSSNEDQSLVLSLDSQVVKMWDNVTGVPYSSIEASAGADFNDLVVYPGSGLMFLANEQPKMQVFYVPSIGPAPKWAKYLDNITEELDESNTATVYDDYKFVTLAELQELGIDHLIGSSLLRAHLHGYFINIKLYKKVLSRVPTNTLENAKKDLIKKQLESQRDKRVKLTTDVPKVNKDLFMKLKIDEVGETKKKKKNNGDLLKDDRFGALFSDERFEVDKEDDAFRLIQPVVSKLDKDKKKEFEKKYAVRDSSDDENKSGDSDLEMVDQLERAEVAEEKRAVFRALTRLRGAAITSFDGVARSQTGNIDEYNKVHKWRNTHPLHHLADEESDISKWAFPDNADSEAWIHCPASASE